MPFLIENVTLLVLAIFILALLGNFFLIGIVFHRRHRRKKFFTRVDAFRERYGPLVGGVLSGRLDYPGGLEELRRISSPDRLSVLERLCLEKKVSPAEEPTLRRLCEDLGLVKIWQQRLMGQVDPASLREALSNPQGLLRRVKILHFLIRSKSAENLGLVRHEASWPLLVKALDDPNPDLQVVAVRSLAAIHHPASFPPLVEQLHKAVLDPASSLSVRILKSALVSFSLESAGELRDSLRHTNPRIRFLATDVIREIVERESSGRPEFRLDSRNFNGEMTEIFVTDLPFDDNPDVRARSAPVIARLDGERAASMLLRLLDDPVWFVRLHAVRSFIGNHFLPYASRISKALTDSNWRVRETAVRTLRGFGQPGLDLLTTHFLSTRDRYSREQIADEFQRAGLVPALLTRFAESGNGRETAVLRHLAEMGKTSCMIAALENGAGNGRLRKSFLQLLGQSLDPQIQQWVEQVSTKDTDFDVRILAREILTDARHQEEE